MKVVLLTGSYPPDICGVGYYSRKLATALQTLGVDVNVFFGTSWKVTNSANIAKRVDRIRPDIIHIQYPSVGYAAGLAPQALSLMRPGIITLHEVSDTHILRRISLYPFSILSKHIIFTNTFERDYASRFAPWILRRSSIIPIGSNIPIGSDISVNNQAKDLKVTEIVYFGLLRPNKGLEDVLALAKLIKEAGLGYRIRIIGMPDPRRVAYFEELRSNSFDLPVRWELGLSEVAVAQLLAKSRIAYVPFPLPDGASERRGSLLALLANGVVTITTSGSHTPRELYGVVEFAQNPKQALQILQNLASDSNRQRHLSARGGAYASRFTWEAIASEHIALYETILC